MLKVHSYKRYAVLLASFVVVAATYAQNASDSWVEMGKNSASGGGISDDAGESLFPAIVIDADGNPVYDW